MDDWTPVKNRSELKPRLLVKALCASCQSWMIRLLCGPSVVGLHWHRREECHNPSYSTQMISDCRCTHPRLPHICLQDGDIADGKILRLADAHVKTSLEQQARDNAFELFGR